MYHLRHKPSKNQAFTQQICRIALTEWDVPIERLSANAIERLADNAQKRFPETCDMRFRNMDDDEKRII